MLKKILATTVIALSLTTSALASPGQPPAVKSWTILTIGPGQSEATTYGTFRTYSSCVSTLKSIVRSNPNLQEYDGTPIDDSFGAEPTLMCIPGTGAYVM